ncbi:DUF418 domain-containing protein [uncultured Corynebacterium sp.]|uniref:DUF418 domain-containing protein n=1 Tax=uncultured Corynebacterium sp. TaxID=159447 RepID=UPI0025FBBB7C|nr:DUF418 domain-containing protein [uncultured Corynebacterium sp.]
MTALSPSSPSPIAAGARIHGLDVARAVAIVGMMAAHLGPWTGRPALADPSSWPAVVNGYPSALFAVLAGVSVGIIARRGVAAGGVELLQSRMRLGTRAVILLAVGLVLASVQQTVIVVLLAMGAMFLVVTPLVAASTRTLAIVAAVLAVAGPALLAPARVWPEAVISPTVRDVVVFTYPLAAWVFYGLVGLLIHRVVLRAPATWPWLAAGGAAIAVAAGVAWSAAARGLGVGESGAALAPTFDDGTGGVDWTVDVGGPDVGMRLLGAFVDGSPHSAGLLDLVGAAGASVAVIAALLMLGRVEPIMAALHPVRMLGSMSLTVYVAHVLSFPAIDVAGAWIPGVAAVAPGTWLVASIIVALIFAVAWKNRHVRGPLEEAMHRAAEKAARIDVPGGTKAS